MVHNIDVYAPRLNQQSRAFGLPPLAVGARPVEQRGLVAPARLVRQLLGRRPIILPRHRPLVKPDQDFQDVVPVGAARGQWMGVRP